RSDRKSVEIVSVEHIEITVPHQLIGPVVVVDEQQRLVKHHDPAVHQMRDATVDPSRDLPNPAPTHPAEPSQGHWKTGQDRARQASHAVLALLTTSGCA